MANKRLGNILRDLRNQKGFTQQQVADLLELKNKSTLGSWEVGKSEPDGYTFLKLCKIYEVQDIYSAFGEVSPISLSHNAKNKIGEVFSPEPINYIDSLVKHYNLTNKDKKILESYVSMDEEKRELFYNFIKSMSNRKESE